MPVPTSTLIFDTPNMASEQSSIAGPSQSPSPPGSSSNASPISVPSMLYTNKSNPPEDAESEQRSTRSTPSRTPVDLTRTQSAGKGGCWTCRIRRKKCDEERQGDSCKTCIRLRIKCLGWGAKRPDWMRDKDRVAEYKAAIKEQLTREGLIRGQPRAMYQKANANANSLLSTQQFQATSAPPSGTNTPTVRRSLSGGSSDFNYRNSFDSTQFNQSPLMSVVPGTNVHDISSMTSFVDPALQDPVFFSSPTIPLINDADHLQYDTYITGNDFMPTPSMPAPSPMSGTVESSTNPEDYFAYYFQEVRKLQFVFAGNALSNTLYSILMSDPRGAVAHAIAGLASLHSARLRIVHGIEAPNRNPERSIPKYFYDQAVIQLMNSKTMNGRYTEGDAIAAVYLITFSTLSGGSTDWTPMLEVACDWFIQTGIHEEQNPKLTLMNMSAVGRFAAKATVWVDVQSSVTLMQRPRFLSLYRRLFAGGAGYWANANEHYDLRMDKLTGCPDEAMLAIAEIAALAQWKATELHNGTLSTRELIKRGDLIEQTLKSRPETQNFSSLENGSPEPPHFGNPNSPTGSTMSDSVMPLAAGLTVPAGALDTTSPTEEMRRTVALDYLLTNTVSKFSSLASSVPLGVSDVVSSVGTLSELFQQLPVSDFDRAVIFPICLTGSMAEDPMMRELMRQRCMYHRDDYVGNMYQARTFIDTVANRRNTLSMSRHRATGGTGLVTVDWRESLRDRWSNLLLC
ncbi:fungal-specific transcription factor domain-containing protein [Abortiporus biennis]|nr:fungal-specific transcription factor domain-containing protein [Abortiporus biennis]